ncbi:MAG: hypothetical protein AAF943_16755 [Pseudomonadota bacterium]
MIEADFHDGDRLPSNDRPPPSNGRGVALMAPLCFAVAFAFVPLAEGIALTFIAPLIVIALRGEMIREAPRQRWSNPHFAARE